MDYPEKVKAAFARAEKPGQLGVTFKELSKVPKPQHGDRWGNWELNARDLTLEYKPRDKHWKYWVDLERMRSSAEVLDWIAQVSRKVERCVSRKDIGDLVKALDDIFGLQGTFCGGAFEITKESKVKSKLSALRTKQLKAKPS